MLPEEVMKWNEAKMDFHREQRLMKEEWETGNNKKVDCTFTQENTGFLPTFRVSRASVSSIGGEPIPPHTTYRGSGPMIQTEEATS